MAKRFTDSSKWSKPFIRGLKTPYKLLWLYILDECDHAGIWQVDIEVAELKIGIKLNLNDAITFFNNKISVIDDGQKWFIYDFIDFQYGELNPQNRAHNSVITILSKYNLLDEHLKIKPLTSPLQGAKDMDKDKDKDMDKDNTGEKNEISQFDRAWGAYLLMRSKNKKTATDRAKELVLMELEKLAPGNESMKVQILEQSIINSWAGVFPLKNQNTTQNGNSKTNNRTNELIGGIPVSEIASFYGTSTDDVLRAAGNSGQ